MNTKKLMKHKQSKHQDVLIYIQKFFSSWNKGGCTGNLASSWHILGRAVAEGGAQGHVPPLEGQLAFIFWYEPFL